LGAAHKLTAQEQALSKQLVGYWTNFMYTGNPNHTGGRPWPIYTGGSAIYLSQNVPNSSPMPAADFLTAHNCAFWDTVLIY
jgi:para-nitrobenzyl esterase